MVRICRLPGPGSDIDWSESIGDRSRIALANERVSIGDGSGPRQIACSSLMTLLTIKMINGWDVIQCARFKVIDGVRCGLE